MPQEVRRQGFAYEWGTFYAHPERVAFIPGERLKEMFLPVVTPEARELLKRHPGFVLGQLKHYDIPLRGQKDFQGNGTALLKRVLAAGQCDEVPDHLVRLRHEMHLTWLRGCNRSVFAGNPEWAIQRYFLDKDGNPDVSKTKSVVTLSYEGRYLFCPRETGNAADAVPGLHYASANGCRSSASFLGWDKAAVEEKAAAHIKREKDADDAADRRRIDNLHKAHQRYLAKLESNKMTNKKQASPVGRYQLRCEQIESEWAPKHRGDFNMSIRNSSESGMMEGSFSFGVVEGGMIMSRQKETLDAYRAKMGDWDESSEESSDDESVASAPSSQSSVPAPDPRESANEAAKQDVPPQKRKAEDDISGGRNPKYAKSSDTEDLVFYMNLRGVETGEGGSFDCLCSGKIMFENEDFSTAKIITDVAFVGIDVKLDAWKVSDVPARGTDRRWEDY